MKRVKWLLWAALLAAGVAALAAQRLGGSERTEKGEFGQVPAFSLTDHRGRTVTDQELRGMPWVANFIFTRCPSACPMLTAKFKALQERLGGAKSPVRFVSITVDPEHDTPEVLAAYAQKFGTDGLRWSFVTGPLGEIQKTVVTGFKIHMGEPMANGVDPTLIDIMHGEHFVLVDGRGVIRGYYRAEQAALDELARDLAELTPTGKLAHVLGNVTRVQP
jgi:protein SCO1/2